MLNADERSALQRELQTNAITGNVTNSALLNQLGAAYGLPTFFHNAPEWDANRQLFQLYQSGGFNPQNTMADPAFANDPDYQSLAQYLPQRYAGTE